MAKLVLSIDGYIGPWGYSKQWFNMMIEGHDNDEIQLNISSLGGSVDDAFAIHDAIIKHGNVHVFLSGFVASAATMIAVAAKTVTMSENSFFLIHKCLSWIDAFGYLNEDDIEELIARLVKEKNENAKITLQIAKLYSNHTGKSNQDILNLMKQDTWLTADEALDWGLIDEIEKLPGQKVDLFQNLSLVAMVTASGLPPLPRRNALNTKPKSKNQSQTTCEMKKFTHVNALLNVEQLESTAEGVFLNLDQLGILNTKISDLSAENIRTLANVDAKTAEATRLAAELATAKTDLATATAAATQSAAELATAKTDLATATATATQSAADLATAITDINAIDKTVADAVSITDKVAAIRSIVASKPGVKPQGIVNKSNSDTPDDSVDWEIMDKLPHNQGIA